MKTILVPTDFSTCARWAEDTAASLARVFQANITMLHHLPAGQDRQAAMDRLEEGAGRFPDLDIETEVTDQDLAEAISAHAPWLVVMGSHGACGKQEYFIGSNTQKIVRRVHLPVLVVKNPFDPERAFRQVVFASDFREAERSAFRQFIDWVKPFTPTVHLVAIHTSALFEPPYIVTATGMEPFRKWCEPLPCETHILADWSVDHGVRAFTESIQADLIGISNYHRHPLRRMLSGSNVEALVNHADVPVLVLDQPQNHTT